MKLVHPKLGLGRARLRAAANPVQFAAQETLSLQLSCLLVFHPGEIRLEVVGVVALVRVKTAGLQLNDVVADFIEEIPIVRGDEKCAAKLFQVLRHPLDRVGVEMVGRLVENQQIGIGDDGATKGDPPLFAAGQRAHQPVRSGSVQMHHRRLDACLDVPRIGGGDLLLQLGLPVRVGGQRLVLVEQLELMRRPVADRIEHGDAVGSLEPLRQITDPQAGARSDFTIISLRDAGENFKKRRLAAAVAPDHPKVIAISDCQRRRLEYLVVVEPNLEFGGVEQCDS